MEGHENLRRDIKDGIIELVKAKFEDKVNVTVDGILCISLNDGKEELIIKIHNRLFAVDIPAIDGNTTSVGTQVEDDIFATNVSLEDALSKAASETPPIKDNQEKDLDRDNSSEGTVVGSGHSDRGSPVKEVEDEQIDEGGGIQDIDEEQQDMDGHLNDVQEHLDDDNPFEDILYEVDEINDIEEHFTGDEANLMEEESPFKSDSMQFHDNSVVSIVKDRFECPIKAVEGQFDDLSEESQIEENAISKERSEDICTSEGMIKIVEVTGGTRETVDNAAEVNEAFQTVESGQVLEASIGDEPGKDDSTKEESRMNVEKEMRALSEELAEVNRMCSEKDVNNKDNDDIVLIDDEEDGAEQSPEEPQPPPPPVQQEEEEPEIQMISEKPASPRKRCYSAANVSSTSLTPANINPASQSRTFVNIGNNPGSTIVSYNSNLNQMNMGASANMMGRTNVMHRTVPNTMPNIASRFSGALQGSAPVTSVNRARVIDQNINQRSSVQVAAADRVEYTCGICSAKFTVYADLSHHLETGHEFQVFLSCVLCYEYFPNRYTFKIHRQLKHKDKNYFRCPHCEVGFGTEECQYHRQECRPDRTSQAASNANDNRQTTGFGGRTFQNPQIARSASVRQVPVSRNPNMYQTTGRQTFAPQAQSITIQGRPQSSRSQPWQPTTSPRSVHSSGQFSGAQYHNQQQQQQQQRNPSPAKIPRFSSAPARSLLNPPVTVPTSMRPQSAPPRRRMDRSIQYICDQCNTTFPNLKDFEMHSLNTHSRYVCPVCSTTFPSKKQADKHLSQHTA